MSKNVINVNSETHKKIKILSAELGIKIYEVVEKAIEEFLCKQKQ